MTLQRKALICALASLVFISSVVLISAQGFVQVDEEPVEDRLQNKLTGGWNHLRNGDGYDEIRHKFDEEFPDLDKYSIDTTSKIDRALDGADGHAVSTSFSERRRKLDALIKQHDAHSRLVLSKHNVAGKRACENVSKLQTKIQKLADYMASSPPEEIGKLAIRIVNTKNALKTAKSICKKFTTPAASSNNIQPVSQSVAVVADSKKICNDRLEGKLIALRKARADAKKDWRSARKDVQDTKATIRKAKKEIKKLQEDSVKAIQHESRLLRKQAAESNNLEIKQQIEQKLNALSAGKSMDILKAEKQLEQLNNVVAVNGQALVVQKQSLKSKKQQFDAAVEKYNKLFNSTTCTEPKVASAQAFKLSIESSGKVGVIAEQVEKKNTTKVPGPVTSTATAQVKSTTTVTSNTTAPVAPNAAVKPAVAAQPVVAIGKPVVNGVQGKNVTATTKAQVKALAKQVEDSKDKKRLAKATNDAKQAAEKALDAKKAAQSAMTELQRLYKLLKVAKSNTEKASLHKQISILFKKASKLSEAAKQSLLHAKGKVNVLVAKTKQGNANVSKSVSSGQVPNVVAVRSSKGRRAQSSKGRRTQSSKGRRTQSSKGRRAKGSKQSIKKRDQALKTAAVASKKQADAAAEKVEQIKDRIAEVEAEIAGTSDNNVKAKYHIVLKEYWQKLADIKRRAKELAHQAEEEKRMYELAKKEEAEEKRRRRARLAASKLKVAKRRESEKSKVKIAKKPVAKKETRAEQLRREIEAARIRAAQQQLEIQREKMRLAKEEKLALERELASAKSAAAKRRLADELNAVKERADRLRAAAARAKREAKFRADELAAAQARKAAEAKAIQDAIAKFKNIEERNKALRDIRRKARIAKAKARKQRRARRLAEKKAEAARLAKLRQERLDRIKKHLSDLQSQLASAASAKARDELEAQLAAAKAERKARKARIEAEKARLRAEAAARKARLAQEKKEKADAKAARQALNAQRLAISKVKDLIKRQQLEDDLIAKQKEFDAKQKALKQKRVRERLARLEAERKRKELEEAQRAQRALIAAKNKAKQLKVALASASGDEKEALKRALARVRAQKKAAIAAAAAAAYAAKIDKMGRVLPQFKQKKRSAAQLEKDQEAARKAARRARKASKAAAKAKALLASAVPGSKRWDDLNVQFQAAKKAAELAKRDRNVKRSIAKRRIVVSASKPVVSQTRSEAAVARALAAKKRLRNARRRVRKLQYKLDLCKTEKCKKKLNRRLRRAADDATRLKRKSAAANRHAKRLARRHARREARAARKAEEKRQRRLAREKVIAESKTPEEKREALAALKRRFARESRKRREAEQKEADQRALRRDARRALRMQRRLNEWNDCISRRNKRVEELKQRIAAYKQGVKSAGVSLEDLKSQLSRREQAVANANESLKRVNARIELQKRRNAERIKENKKYQAAKKAAWRQVRKLRKLFEAATGKAKAQLKLQLQQAKEDARSVTRSAPERHYGTSSRYAIRARRYKRKIANFTRKLKHWTHRRSSSRCNRKCKKNWDRKINDLAARIKKLREALLSVEEEAIAFYKRQQEQNKEMVKQRADDLQARAARAGRLARRTSRTVTKLEKSKNSCKKPKSCQKVQAELNDAIIARENAINEHKFFERLLANLRRARRDWRHSIISETQARKAEKLEDSVKELSWKVDNLKKSIDASRNEKRADKLAVLEAELKSVESQKAAKEAAFKKVRAILADLYKVKKSQQQAWEERQQVRISREQAELISKIKASSSNPTLKAKYEADLVALKARIEQWKEDEQEIKLRAAAAKKERADWKARKVAAEENVVSARRDLDYQRSLRRVYWKNRDWASLKRARRATKLAYRKYAAAYNTYKEACERPVKRDQFWNDFWNKVNKDVEANSNQIL